MKKNHLVIIVFGFLSATIQAQAPGGVNTNLQIWVKADAGTGTTTDGAQVPTWVNQRTGGVDGIANQGMPGYVPASGTRPDPGESARPIYRTSENALNFNFNPAIEIVSTDQYRSGYKFPSGFPDNTTNAMTSYTHLTRTASATYRTVFVINGNDSRNSNTTEVAGQWQSPYFGTQFLRPNYFNEKESGGNALFGSRSIPSANSQIPSIQSFYNTLVGANMRYRFDNNFIYFGEPSDGRSSVGNYPSMILLVDNDGGDGTASLRGDRIGEFILYSETQAPEVRQKINSYLAIKYGVTLGETNNLVNYLNSTSTSTSTGVVWNADIAAYQNNVFGIGRDDASALHQRISNSVDANNRGIVVLSTDADFESANTAHANIPTNLQFTMVGDNSATTAYGTVVNIDGKSFRRMNRIWRAQDTGDMGCINIRFRTNTTGNIIAAPPAGSNLYLIAAEDAGFTTNVRIKRINHTPPAIDVAINFSPNSNNNYFTLATLANNAINDTTTGPAPVGISTSPNGWIPTAPNTYVELHARNLGMVVTRLTTTARNNLTQQSGMLVYDTTLGRFFVSDGTNWREFNTFDSGGEDLGPITICS